MGSDRKYTSIFIGVQPRAHHIIYSYVTAYTFLQYGEWQKILKYFHKGTASCTPYYASLCDCIFISAVWGVTENPQVFPEGYCIMYSLFISMWLNIESHMNGIQNKVCPVYLFSHVLRTTFNIWRTTRIMSVLFFHPVHLYLKLVCHILCDIQLSTYYFKCLTWHRKEQQIHTWINSTKLP